AAEDGRITPNPVAQKAEHIDVGLRIDDQVTAGDEVVEILDRRVAAQERLCLVEVRGGAAIETAELDRLLAVEHAQSAPLDALQDRFELAPVGSALLDESRQVHALPSVLPFALDAQACLQR